ncbi:uncharacterized protein LOC101899123 [Musca domestica]|uniref:Uncharacterized protein LOC101899123 n=1 Tax=Musca domestica TaxID=7370 RepID=A0A9J7CR17_MUSDO|nr:uncharacterized protein LOC101899123 [Musca domestica]
MPSVPGNLPRKMNVPDVENTVNTNGCNEYESPNDSRKPAKRGRPMKRRMTIDCRSSLKEDTEEIVPKRGRGRPVGSKNKKKLLQTYEFKENSEESEPVREFSTWKRRYTVCGDSYDEIFRSGNDDDKDLVKTPRGRGRPKGSKNKSKLPKAIEPFIKFPLKIREVNGSEPNNDDNKPQIDSTENDDEDRNVSKISCETKHKESEGYPKTSVVERGKEIVGKNNLLKERNNCGKENGKCLGENNEIPLSNRQMKSLDDMEAKADLNSSDFLDTSLKSKRGRPKKSESIGFSDLQESFNAMSIRKRRYTVCGNENPFEEIQKIERKNDATTPRARGRPKGSKNKPKLEGFLKLPFDGKNETLKKTKARLNKNTDPQLNGTIRETLMSPIRKEESAKNGVQMVSADVKKTDTFSAKRERRKSVCFLSSKEKKSMVLENFFNKNFKVSGSVAKLPPIGKEKKIRDPMKKGKNSPVNTNLLESSDLQPTTDKRTLSSPNQRDSTEKENIENLDITLSNISSETKIKSKKKPNIPDAPDKGQNKLKMHEISSNAPTTNEPSRPVTENDMQSLRGEEIKQQVSSGKELGIATNSNSLNNEVGNSEEPVQQSNDFVLHSLKEKARRTGNDSAESDSTAKERQQSIIYNMSTPTPSKIGRKKKDGGNQLPDNQRFREDQLRAYSEKSTAQIDSIHTGAEQMPSPRKKKRKKESEENSSLEDNNSLENRNKARWNDEEQYSIGREIKQNFSMEEENRSVINQEEKAGHSSGNIAGNLENNRNISGKDTNEDESPPIIDCEKSSTSAENTIREKQARENPLSMEGMDEKQYPICWRIKQNSSSQEADATAFETTENGPLQPAREMFSPSPRKKKSKENTKETHFIREENINGRESYLSESNSIGLKKKRKKRLEISHDPYEAEDQNQTKSNESPLRKEGPENSLGIGLSESQFYSKREMKEAESPLREAQQPTSESQEPDLSSKAECGKGRKSPKKKESKKNIGETHFNGEENINGRESYPSEDNSIGLKKKKKRKKKPEIPHEPCEAETGNESNINKSRSISPLRNEGQKNSQEHEPSESQKYSKNEMKEIETPLPEAQQPLSESQEPDFSSMDERGKERVSPSSESIWKAVENAFKDWENSDCEGDNISDHSHRKRNQTPVAEVNLNNLNEPGENPCQLSNQPAENVSQTPALPNRNNPIEENQTGVKRKRGRPRKHPLPEVNETETNKTPKYRGGRPKGARNKTPAERALDQQMKMQRRNILPRSEEGLLLRKIPRERLDESLAILKDKNSPVWEERNTSCLVSIHRHWEDPLKQACQQRIRLKYARQFLLRRDWVNLCKVLCISAKQKMHYNISFYPILAKFGAMCLAHNNEKEEFDAFMQMLANIDDGKRVLKKITQLPVQQSDEE